VTASCRQVDINGTTMWGVKGVQSVLFRRFRKIDKAAGSFVSACPPALDSSALTGRIFINLVKYTLEQATKAHRGNRGMAILFV
jgi:hypothetical protein